MESQSTKIIDKRPDLFRSLLQDCGLSARGASNLLAVRYDTIRNWKSGKCRVPDQVMIDLTKYADAANEIFKGA